MPPPDELSYVYDACQEMRRVLALVTCSTPEDYAADRILQAAVERGVHIVGEALSRTTDTFRQRHPQVPWRKLIAARIPPPTTLGSSWTSSWQ